MFSKGIDRESPNMPEPCEKKHDLFLYTDWKDRYLEEDIIRIIGKGKKFTD
jgi:hypothetical protein